MDEREPSNIIVGAEVGANSDIASRATLFTANK
jgi:hypothetical protein